MFRRKDELDLDGDVDTQGSLLGNTEPDTVNVLSPEKAAEYNAGKQGGQSSNRSAVAAPSFRCVSIARFWANGQADSCAHSSGGRCISPSWYCFWQLQSVS